MVGMSLQVRHDRGDGPPAAAIDPQPRHADHARLLPVRVRHVTELRSQHCVASPPHRCISLRVVTRRAAQVHGPEGGEAAARGGALLLSARGAPTPRPVPRPAATQDRLLVWPPRRSYVTALLSCSPGRRPVRPVAHHHPPAAPPQAHARVVRAARPCCTARPCQSFLPRSASRAAAMARVHTACPVPARASYSRRVFVQAASVVRAQARPRGGQGLRLGPRDVGARTPRHARAVPMGPDARPCGHIAAAFIVLLRAGTPSRPAARASSTWCGTSCRRRMSQKPLHTSTVAPCTCPQGRNATCP